MPDSMGISNLASHHSIIEVVRFATILHFEQKRNSLVMNSIAHGRQSQDSFSPFFDPPIKSVQINGSII
jgi:hypothetical protein